MVRPAQLDAVWEPNHFAYNRYLAGLLRRARCLNRLLRTDVTHLIEECNATWLSAWEIVGAVCGDEAVVPHTGSNWHGMRQYIARKPHFTGRKLYVLCDNTYGYVFDVYLYTGCRGRIHRTGTCAGNVDAKGIMRLWAL